MAMELAPHFDAYGYAIQGHVTQVTGSLHEGYCLGVCIAFTLPAVENEVKEDTMTKVA